MKKGGNTLNDQDKRNSSQKDKVVNPKSDGPILNFRGFDFPITDIVRLGFNI
jgi:hypothetical protein